MNFCSLYICDIKCTQIKAHNQNLDSINLWKKYQRSVKVYSEHIQNAQKLHKKLRVFIIRGLHYRLLRRFKALFSHSPTLLAMNGAWEHNKLAFGHAIFHWTVFQFCSFLYGRSRVRNQFSTNICYRALLSNSLPSNIFFSRSSF